MIVDFIDVGPGDTCWTAEIEKLDHDLFYREVKSRGVLGSSNIDFSIDDRGINGQVIVGHFRVVGKFKIRQKESA